MSSEIVLIGEIERRPCLYNYTLHEYNKKDVLEQAWTEIAIACQMTVAECKDKWKNIRSSYLRSLKITGSSKFKKPYYLSTCLQFITPFLKTVDYNNDDDSDDNDNNASDSAVDSLEVPLLTAVKEELVDLETELTPGQSNYGNDTNSIEMKVTKPNVLTINPRGNMLRKRRKVVVPQSNENIRRPAPAPAALPTHTVTPAPVRNEEDNPMRFIDNPMRLFLMSLLPEFDTMNEFQIRLFKIKVMMLIDDIKTKCEEVKQTLRTDNEENLRLQKRLINLLLKNTLKKK